MFSTERRAKLMSSLQKDPVPVSEVFFETVSEVRGDMIILKSRHNSQYQQDYDLLNKTAKLYDEYHLTDLNKAIDAMEVVYDLRDKYDALRFEKVAV
ncbi:MAG: hypothetical protein IJV35_08715 [Neisseriaceae bacterium]|nr:hypothetical protein [Neisseriaceae bacterium]